MPSRKLLKELDIWVLVHGDDFVIIARKAGREFALKILKAAYELKIDIAGPEADYKKEIKK